jgi:hypothetical protein
LYSNETPIPVAVSVTCRFDYPGLAVVWILPLVSSFILKIAPLVIKKIMLIFNFQLKIFQLSLRPRTIVDRFGILPITISNKSMVAVTIQSRR